MEGSRQQTNENRRTGDRSRGTSPSPLDTHAGEARTHASNAERWRRDCEEYSLNQQTANVTYENTLTNFNNQANDTGEAAAASGWGNYNSLDGKIGRGGEASTRTAEAQSGGRDRAAPMQSEKKRAKGAANKYRKPQEDGYHLNPALTSLLPVRDRNTNKHNAFALAGALQNEAKRVYMNQGENEVMPCPLTHKGQLALLERYGESNLNNWSRHFGIRDAKTLRNPSEHAVKGEGVCTEHGCQGLYGIFRHAQEMVKCDLDDSKSDSADVLGAFGDGDSHELYEAHAALFEALGNSGFMLRIIENKAQGHDDYLDREDKRQLTFSFQVEGRDNPVRRTAKKEGRSAPAGGTSSGGAGGGISGVKHDRETEELPKRAGPTATPAKSEAHAERDTETVPADARQGEGADARGSTMTSDNNANEVRQNNADDGTTTANEACGEWDATDAVMGGEDERTVTGAVTTLAECGEALYTQEEPSRVDEATRMMKQRIAEYGSGKPRRTCEKNIRGHSGGADKSDTHNLN